MQIRGFEAKKGRGVAIDIGISYKYWSTLLPKKTDLCSTVLVKVEKVILLKHVIYQSYGERKILRRVRPFFF